MSEDLIAALYPPPPVFYKYFTKENLEKFNSDDPPPIPELKFLSPPEKPQGTHYRGYGNIWSFDDVLPTLEELNLRQLYPDSDTNSMKIQLLHKLVKALLVQFIELLGILSVNPHEFQDTVENLKVILININHILNSYRPHQSRELLITMLMQRITEKNREIKLISQTIDEVTRLLGEMAD